MKLDVPDPTLASIILLTMMYSTYRGFKFGYDISNYTVNNFCEFDGDTNKEDDADKKIKLVQWVEDVGIKTTKRITNMELLENIGLWYAQIEKRLKDSCKNIK